MAESERFSVAVSDLTALMAHSIEQGMSTRKLLQQLALPKNTLDDPDALINMDDCWRIITANKNAIHEESLLMSSRPLKRGTTRLILSNLYRCKNLSEGLQSLAETYNVVHGDDYNFVRKHANTLIYIVDDRHFHYQVKPNVFAIELALLDIHFALSILTGQQLKLVRMATKRERLPAHHHHLKLFDSPLLTGHNYYELAYRADQADLPLQPSQDIDIAGNLYAHYLPRLQTHQQARQQEIYGDSFIREVMQKIKQGSNQEKTRTQESIASRLNMSMATLRRRLKDKHCNFQQLLDKVNSELAVNDLHEQMPPADVAERLGYSDVRSFKRAFKRWHGQSPSEYINTSTAKEPIKHTL